jgi:hypothetical protein
VLRKHRADKELHSTFHNSSVHSVAAPRRV